MEHGGFLMALGLNGHLSKLGKLESFDYLVRFKLDFYWEVYLDLSDKLKFSDNLKSLFDGYDF